MNNTRWTDDEKKSLRNMWAERKTVASIAQALGKSESGVKNQRRFLSLPPRRTGDLTVKIRVGIHKDDHTLFRNKAMRNSQTVPGRIRQLIQDDARRP